jgi:hypothetical protein
MADIISNGKEIGFGSANWSGNPRDAGFGAPWPLSVGNNEFYHNSEAGFGDPFILPKLQIDDPKDPPPGKYQNFNKLADNGGEVLRIFGNLNGIRRILPQDPGAGVPLGPFVVEFYQLNLGLQETGVKYKAESAIPGLRHNLYSNADQTEILFTTPVLPKGSYNVKISLSGRGRPQVLKSYEVITRLRFDKTMSIKHNLPSYWALGEKTDAYDASGGYVRGQDGTWDTLIQSTGETFNNLYNNAYTVVTQTYTQESSNNLYVETSLGFNPDGGRLIIGNDEYEYSGVGRDATDANVHFITGVKKLVRGSGLHPRQHPIENPKIYSGLDQNLLHDDIFDPIKNELALSEGPDEPIIQTGERVYLSHYNFSEIDLFYKLINTGFQNPGLIVKENFERAYNRVEYGERELMRVIFEYFYEMFRQLNFKPKFSDTQLTFRKFADEIGNPDRWGLGNEWRTDESYRPDVGVLYDIGDSSLNCSHVQRLVRIFNKFYFINNRFIDNSGNMSYQIDHVGCTYWNGMDEDLAQSLEDLNVAELNGNVEILPWIIFKDHGGRFHIRFERTCFRGFDSYLNRDFIEFDLFISGLNGEEEMGNTRNRNLNFLIMCAANIDDKIYLKQRCGDNFGTYLNPNQNPSNDTYVQVTRNLL